ncbi:anion permease [Cytobacillus sp. Sa5YUA1]|uniref:Anion permease n=1 Tax=Cytobacillus stercorigallinarum TaxID=2762240 RepID=A0ABR8QT86_9BACI|nr:SLC13 family permease [Cytobacillus stercorigallinarum]MBD7938639.1 anion permease [Cytobacillus stercorigallinarum]
MNTKRFNGTKSFLKRFMMMLLFSFSVIVVLSDELTYDAKVVLIVFLLTLILWTGTRLPVGYVAIGSLLLLIFLNAAEQELLYTSLSTEIIWMLIGAYIIGEGFRSSGLSGRMTSFIIERANHTQHILFYLLLALLPLSFIIPSTSGRAAIMQPIVKDISQQLNSVREKEILALFVPVIILLTTSSTLLGAGSHLIGNELLEANGGERISYINWLIWGLPFSITIGLVAFIIFIIFFSRALIYRKNKTTRINKRSNPQPLMTIEKKTITILTILIVLWVTESYHQVDLGLITMLGAFALMTPKYGVISWKKGLQSVSWNLILFVASATALGKQLVETGAVHWIENGVFQLLQIFSFIPDGGLVAIMILIAITSHLYITSHTTRAVILIPSIIMLSYSLQLEAQTMVFLSLIGMNYCLTFPVSSKALLIYFEDEGCRYNAKDLSKMNLILMPIYFLLMIIFLYTYWHWTGLTIS